MYPAWAPIIQRVTTTFQFKEMGTSLHGGNTKNAVQRKEDLITQSNNKKCSSKERELYYKEK